MRFCIASDGASQTALLRLRRVTERASCAVLMVEQGLPVGIRIVAVDGKGVKGKAEILAAASRSTGPELVLRAEPGWPKVCRRLTLQAAFLHRHLAFN